MSEALVRISVDGKDDFKRTFKRMDACFDDLSPIWPDVRDEFWRIETEQFDSEGRKGGSGQWKSLSKRYEREKISRYGAGLKILEASGALKASLTGNAPGTFYQTTPKEIAVGTTIAYGMYHHRGTQRVPKREVISFSDQQRNRLQKVIQGSLVKELRRGNYYVPVTERSF